MSAKKNLSSALCLEIKDRLGYGQTLTQIGLVYEVHRSSIARLLKRSGFDYAVRSRPQSGLGYRLCFDSDPGFCAYRGHVW